jgi:hypothetical protein
MIYVWRLGLLRAGELLEAEVEHSRSDQGTPRAALSSRFMATLGFTPNQTFGCPRRKAVALRRQFCLVLLMIVPFQTFVFETLSASGTIVAGMGCRNKKD